MQDYGRIKRNISKMIDQGAPESDIDQYLSEEGVTAEQLRQPQAKPEAPSANGGGRHVALDGNNTGGIIDSPFARSQPGYQGANGRYAKFDTLDNGVSAHTNLLKSYVERGIDTPAKIAARWAPAGADGNDPVAYAAGIAQRLGIGVNDKITLDQVPAFQQAQAVQENNMFGRDGKTAPGPSSHAPASAPTQAPLDPQTILQRLQNAYDSHASKADLLALAQSMNVSKDTQATIDKLYGKPGLRFVQGDMAATPAPQEESWGDMLARIGKQAVGGLEDAVTDTVGSATDLLGHALGGGPTSKLVGTTLAALARKKLDDEGILVAAPKTAGERYTRVGFRGLGNSAVPGGGLAKMGERVLPVVASSVGSSLGGEAGHDVASVVAPGNAHVDELLSTGGTLVGGGAPFAPRAMNELGSSLAANRMAKDPRAANIGYVAKRINEVSGQQAPNGVMPKGRGPVTVDQLGGLESEFLANVKTKLNALPIPKERKMALKDAIIRRKVISPEEIQAIRGTPEGDRVADGIEAVQTLRGMTPPYGGPSKMGPIGTAAEIALNVGMPWLTSNPLTAVAGTLARKVMRANPGDVNMSRLDAARKIVKNKKVYEKLRDKVGPAPIESSAPAFDQLYNETVSKPAPEDLNAADNAAIERQADLENVPPEGGFRGLLRNRTGLLQSEQDAAALQMLTRGKISLDTYNRFLSDPKSFMKKGKKPSTAGLKLADRMAQMVKEEGWLARRSYEIPRSMQPQVPGSPVWLDAQGQPIRSMGAYAGGIAKNIVNDQLAKQGPLGSVEAQGDVADTASMPPEMSSPQGLYGDMEFPKQGTTEPVTVRDTEGFLRMLLEQELKTKRKPKKKK